uniref:Uncharacterized protein n=1 Tax=Oryza sativa subsp. japonica TaxID=39947 RepID=Q6ZFQ7_ORYSJ|nr:hypothetical protein [Oryza sativa Japonica Group]
MAGIRYSNPASLSSPTSHVGRRSPAFPGHVRPSPPLFKLLRRSLSLFPPLAELSRASHRSRAVQPLAAAVSATPAAASRRWGRRRTAPSPPLGSRGRDPPRPPLLRRGSSPERHSHHATMRVAMSAAFGRHSRLLWPLSSSLTSFFSFFRSSWSPSAACRPLSVAPRRRTPPSPPVRAPSPFIFFPNSPCVAAARARRRLWSLPPSAAAAFASFLRRRLRRWMPSPATRRARAAAASPGRPVGFDAEPSPAAASIAARPIGPRAI